VVKQNFSDEGILKIIHSFGINFIFQMEQLNTHPLYRKHNLDSAMGSLWDFYKQRFLPLFIASFIISLIIQYASSLINFQELTTTTDPMIVLEKIRSLALPLLGISVVNLLLNAILQYYVLYNPIDRSTGFLASAMKTMKYLIPYFIIMILLAVIASFAIIIGIILLVIGVVFSVVYVMSLYLLILPVLMVEGTNIGHVISRVFSLLHRSFWPTIGWVSVFIILMLVISIVTSGIVLIPFTGTFIKGVMNPAEASDLVTLARNPLYIILSALAGALVVPIVPIFSCILYFNGVAKEQTPVITREEEPENRPLRVEDLYAKPYSDDHPDNPEKKTDQQD